MQWSLRLLAVVSLVALVAMAIAYPVSFYRAASVRRLSPGLIAVARVSGGRLSVYWQRYPPTHAGPASWSAAVGTVREKFFRTNQRWRDALRFDLTAQEWRTSANATIVGRTVVVPLWTLIVAAALPPAAAAQRWHTRRRRAAGGRCLACGYDLRHTPAGVPNAAASRRRPADRRLC